MIKVAHKVGRLVEVRIVTPVTAEELRSMTQDVSIAHAACAPRPIVGCTDLRGANLFPVELADQVSAFMKRSNPKIERGGYIIGEGAVFGLQLERVIREAANPTRKTFRVRRELEVWLGEVLSPAERQRLGHFLDEGDEVLAAANRRPSHA